jgi:hypothetical protein
MRIILLIGLLVLCSIQWSCSKSDGKISYHTFYHKTKIKPSSGILVYSNQGQITDIDIVNRLIAIDSFYFSYHRNDITSSYNNYHDSIEFIDALHAKVLIDYNNWSNCDITDQFPRLILTRKDTLTVSGVQYDPFSQTLPYWLCQYKPLIYQEWLVSSTRGYYLFGYSGNDKFAFKLSGDQLYAHITMYVEHKQLFQTGYVNNFLDENFYLNLPDGDTVTIQSHSLLYEK